jgi:hypothetical protein
VPWANCAGVIGIKAVAEVMPPRTEIGAPLVAVAGAVVVVPLVVLLVGSGGTGGTQVGAVVSLVVLLLTGVHCGQLQAPL